MLHVHVLGGLEDSMLYNNYEFPCLRRESVLHSLYICSLFSKHEDDRSEGAGREVVRPQWKDKVVNFI